MISNNSLIYEKHEEIYRKLKGSGHEGWGGANFSNRITGWEKNIERVSKHLPSSKGLLLEIGCGTGDVSRLFNAIGYSVEGVDISETAINWAKAKSATLNDNIKFAAYDICNIELWENKKYQVIVDGNCLHCILGEDRKKLLNNIYNCLDDDGSLIISSIIKKDDDCNLDRDKTTQSLNSSIAPVERHLTNKESLEKELVESNFRIIESWLSHSKNHDHYFAVLDKLKL